MKKLLLATLLFSHYAFAGDTSLDLLNHAKTYTIQIKDTNNNVVFDNNLIFPNNVIANNSIKKYYNTCDGEFETLSYDNANFAADITEQEDQHQILTLSINDFINKNDLVCNLDSKKIELEKFNFTEKFDLPIISYHNMVYLDKSKKEFYYINISSKK